MFPADYSIKLDYTMNDDGDQRMNLIHTEHMTDVVAMSCLSVVNLVTIISVQW